jgi:prevent-host-death family protein
MCNMKTVTIREAQHNLSQVLHAVEAGEVVEILRRKTPIARIVPIDERSDGSHTVDWKGHGKQMASIWGETIIASSDVVLDDLRGGR